MVLFNLNLQKNANVFKDFYSDLVGTLLRKLPAALNKFNNNSTKQLFFFFVFCFLFLFFFPIWVFFYEHSQITGPQGKGEGISLTPHYHFHLLHRHLDISRAIAAESSPLHIASSRTRTGSL